MTKELDPPPAATAECLALHPRARDGEQSASTQLTLQPSPSSAGVWAGITLPTAHIQQAPGRAVFGVGRAVDTRAQALLRVVDADSQSPGRVADKVIRTQAGQWKGAVRARVWQGCSGHRWSGLAQGGGQSEPRQGDGQGSQNPGRAVEGVVRVQAEQWTQVVRPCAG